MAYDKDKMKAMMAEKFGKGKGKDKESKKPEKDSEDTEKEAAFVEEALLEGLKKHAEEDQENADLMDALMYGLENPSIVTKIAKVTQPETTTMESAVERLRASIQG